jgi:hypothetical protein
MCQDATGTLLTRSAVVFDLKREPYGAGETRFRLHKLQPSPSRIASVKCAARVRDQVRMAATEVTAAVGGPDRYQRAAVVVTHKLGALELDRSVVQSRAPCGSRSHHLRIKSPMLCRMS